MIADSSKVVKLQAKRPGAAVVTGMLIVLFAFTIFVIVDLDRPRRGLIRVSQISMTELKKSLDKPLP